MKPEIQYVGNRITYQSLRDVILDKRLTNSDTVLMNPVNFDEIVLEYRERYNESIIIPHLLLGVLIKEDKNGLVPLNRIGIFKNDKESVREVFKREKFEYYDGEEVYRCGWCGNTVDDAGNVLEGYDRERTINYIENHESPTVKQRNGKCCPNGHG